MSSSREEDTGVDVCGLKQKVEVLEHELKMCRAELQKLQKQLSQSQQLENKDDYNEDLRQQVKMLSAELHAQQKQETKTDAETQTEHDAWTETEHHTWTQIDHSRYDYDSCHFGETEPDVLEDAAAETPCSLHPQSVDLLQSSPTPGESKESGTTNSNNLLQPQTGDSGSIADMLRATAEEALFHTGYVFDENSGMYYDHSTGFFYDSANQLYYDSNTGIYYYYDADSGKYQFHSKIELLSTQTDHEPHVQRTADKKTRSKKNTIGALVHEDGDRTGEGLRSGKNGPEIECQKRKKSMTGKCRKSCSTEHEEKAKKSKKSCHNRSHQRSVKEKKAKKKKREKDDTHSDTSKRRHKKTLKAKRKKHSSQRHEDKQRSKREHSTDSELEEGEITESEGQKSTSSSSSSSSDTPNSPNTEEVAPEAPEAWPPCVRVTVVRSPTLQIGSLSILTADAAATIGSSPSWEEDPLWRVDQYEIEQYSIAGEQEEKDLDHAVRIPEVEVSKSHAEVYFDLDQQCYMLVDLGSQNGTVVNGKRIFQPKVRCEPCPLSHGDEVKIGETVLSFHIHPGTDTCDGCEPGQIIAHLSRHPKEQNSGHVVGEDKELVRQRELKQMKVKYGLKNSDFEDVKALSNPLYKDRAKTRRKVVGSEGTFHRDDSPSSLYVEISEVNKGRKMLEKMGWKRGDGLGKDGAGMKDPIQLQVRKAQSGLGSCMFMPMDHGTMATTKTQEKWRKAQERFIETCQTPPPDTPPLPSSAVKSRSLKAWVKGESTD